MKEEGSIEGERECVEHFVYEHL